jgi:hypothetical protein
MSKKISRALRTVSPFDRGVRRFFLVLSFFLGLPPLSASAGPGEAFAMQGVNLVLTKEQIKARVDALLDKSGGNPLCSPPAATPNLNRGPYPKTGAPPPIRNWLAWTCATPYGDKLDAQIAVSSSHVIVAFQDLIAWYDKDGSWKGELRNFDLFSSVLSSIVGPSGKIGMANPIKDAPMGALPPGGCGVSPPAVQPLCAQAQSDFRVIFDEYRKRFWVIDGAGVYLDGNPPRGIILCAVSKSEDPADGWYLYWFDAVAQWNNPAGGVYQKFTSPTNVISGDIADYPRIGIDPAAFHFVIDVTIPNKSDPSKKDFRYEHLALFDAQAAVNGNPPQGWHFYDLQNPNSTDAATNLVPVVHHGVNQQAAPSRAYYASKHGDDRLVVWGLTDPLESTQKMDSIEVDLSVRSGPQCATLSTDIATLSAQTKAAKAAAAEATAEAKAAADAINRQGPDGQYPDSQQRNSLANQNRTFADQASKFNSQAKALDDKLAQRQVAFDQNCIMHLQPASYGFAPQKGTLETISMRADTVIMNSVYRGGSLYLTLDDANNWFYSNQYVQSVRVVRLSLQQFPTAIPTLGDPGYLNVRIGKNASGDPTNSQIYYGWQAIEVNSAGDVVIVYNRSGTKIYPQVHYSVIFGKDSDVRGSRVLKEGDGFHGQFCFVLPPNTCPVSSWGDNAGAAWDPVPFPAAAYGGLPDLPGSREAIWIAQQFANANHRVNIWVGQILGVPPPSVSPKPVGIQKPGGQKRQPK